MLFQLTHKESAREGTLLCAVELGASGCQNEILDQVAGD